MHAQIPLSARVHLSHAAVETIALDAGVDLLHIKGPALLPDLRARDRGSSDVDVLVAPAHLARLRAGARPARVGAPQRLRLGIRVPPRGQLVPRQLGLRRRARPLAGSPGGCRGGVRGVRPGQHRQDIAHVPCRVPNRTAQILILVLHAARSHGSSADIELAWNRVTQEDRDAVRALADRAAGPHRLRRRCRRARLRRRRPLRPTLWRYYSQEGGSRLDEWRARWRAAETLRERLDVVVQRPGGQPRPPAHGAGPRPLAPRAGRPPVAARPRCCRARRSSALRRRLPPEGRAVSDPARTWVPATLADREPRGVARPGRPRAGRGVRQRPARRSARWCCSATAALIFLVAARGGSLDEVVAGVAEESGQPVEEIRDDVVALRRRAGRRSACSPAADRGRRSRAACRDLVHGRLARAARPSSTRGTGGRMAAVPLPDRPTNRPSPPPRPARARRPRAARLRGAAPHDAASTSPARRSP